MASKGSGVQFPLAPHTNPWSVAAVNGGAAVKSTKTGAGGGSRWRPGRWRSSPGSGRTAVTLNTYGHFIPAADRAAADALGELLGESG